MTNSIAQKFNFFSLLRFALPTMVMMVFMSLYTIVDGAFVSRLVGSNALSAVNIVYPFINVLFACGIMLATGGSAIVAKQLGEQKEQQARENYSLITFVAFVIGLIFLIGGIIFLTPICKMLGATPLILSDCKQYLGVLLLFAPVTMLQMIFQVFFVTAGNPTLGLILTVAGGFVNMILDYIFMGPLRMGAAGAAIATGLGQTITVVVGLLYFALYRRNLYFVKPVFRSRVLVDSCGNGASEMVSNLSMAVVTFLFNMIMIRMLGEDGVAAITIVLYGQFLFSSIYLGFSMGVAPVISYNYGDNNYLQLQRIFKICITFLTVTSIVILVLSLIFAKSIVGFFTGPGTETYAIAVVGFPLFSLNYLFAGINIFASAMFTAFSDGKTSAVISFCRTFVFIVISILALPYVIGITGVWLAVPLAEIVTLLVTLVYFKRKKAIYHYI